MVFRFCVRSNLAKRNSITHIDPLMTDEGAMRKDIIPRFEVLVNNMQQQKSHQR